MLYSCSHCDKTALNSEKKWYEIDVKKVLNSCEISIKTALNWLLDGIKLMLKNCLTCVKPVFTLHSC